MQSYIHEVLHFVDDFDQRVEHVQDDVVAEQLKTLQVDVLPVHEGQTHFQHQVEQSAARLRKIYIWSCWFFLMLASRMTATTVLQCWCMSWKQPCRNRMNSMELLLALYFSALFKTKLLVDGDGVHQFVGQFAKAEIGLVLDQNLVKGGQTHERVLLEKPAELLVLLNILEESEEFVHACNARGDCELFVLIGNDCDQLRDLDAHLQKLHVVKGLDGAQQLLDLDSELQVLDLRTEHVVFYADQVFPQNKQAIVDQIRVFHLKGV